MPIDNTPLTPNPSPRKTGRKEPEPPIRAVFFDAGNTLLGFTTPPLDVYLAGASSVEVEIDRGQFSEIFAQQWPLLVTHYRSKYPDWRSSEQIERQAWIDFTRSLAEPFPELAARHADWHRALVVHFDAATAWKPVDGALELLANLKRNNIAVGVISNWHSALHRILAEHGFRKHVDFVLISSEVGRKKPHEAMFRQALDMAGVEAAAAVHVGDSWHDDVEGSLAVGISPILLGKPSAAAEAANVPTAGSMSEVATLLGPRIPK